MLQKLKSRLLNAPIIKETIELSKKIILPGFDGISLYETASFFISSIQKGAIATRASSLAFKFFLALFPTIIFLFSLIPYVPIDDFQVHLLDQLRTLMPAEAYSLSREVIESLVQDRKGSVLSFGFLLSLYFATNGINAMITAFNQSHLEIEKRNFFKQRLISIYLGIILALLVITAVTLIVFGTSLISTLLNEHVIEEGWPLFLLQMGRWAVIIALFYFSVSFIYYIGPSRKTKWNFFSAGSSLATLLIIVTSLGFAFFVNNFGQYNKLYGSIGSLIVIMLWIYFNSLIMLVGFELNASIKSAKKQRAKQEPA